MNWLMTTAGAILLTVGLALYVLADPENKKMNVASAALVLFGIAAIFAGI